MKFNNAQDALNWLVNHPHKNLYDEYSNYYVFAPNSNIIEYYHNLGDWEDEDGNFYPGDWDFDRININEFLEYDLSGDNYLENI